MKADGILKAALGHMEDRAATYDNPEGERSMPVTVSAFNALTGHQLTAEQGWLFMTVLKLCRTQQGGFRADNYEDGAAYFALMGEQAAGDRVSLEIHTPVGSCEAGPVAFTEPSLDPDQLANSSKSATHRDGGGNLYKVCDMSGRWLRYGNTCWFFASSNPKEIPDGLKPLKQPETDPYGPRDAEGWYTWNGDETMRPAGQVFYLMRDGGKGRDNAGDLSWRHGKNPDDIVKWRPAQ